MKKRLLSALLALCMCFALAVCAYGDEVKANETADFTADADGALKLLNAAKWSGAEDSTWDRTTNTLTLKGVNFQTTAATAVKLPAGTTIVLAAETYNNFYGGDADANETGSYHNDIYVYGIYAEGALTIQGSGSLKVQSGKHTNTGDAWTYSTALYAKGLVTVEDGKVELTGGEATSGDCAFSIGLELPEGSGLSVTGGALTATGGRSTDTENGTAHSSFSRGIYAYGSGVSVSGSGKLTGNSNDPHGGLSYGIYVSSADLTVSGSADVMGVSNNAIYISGGDLIQHGGSIIASHTAGDAAALTVWSAKFGNGPAIGGRIEITGGSLEVWGDLSMYNSAEATLTVSGEDTRVSLGTVYGARQFSITGATVTSGRISAKSLTLNSGSLTVIESVEEDNGRLYADPALWLQDLTVNSGTLNVSWYWGENAPIVFPVGEYTGFSTPLVRMWGDDYTAAFNGGTSTFDTGCAGNIVLKLGLLSLGKNVVETGANGTDTGEHTQKHSDTPVVFSDVERKPVTVTGITVESRTYDGTTAATLTGGTLAGVANGDEVSLDLSGVTAAFKDANADVGKPVAASGTVALRGRDAYKYVAEQPTFENLTATISARGDFDDVTNRTQTVTTGSGSFAAPRFTGIGGETVEGTVTYDKTAEEIAAALSALKAGESFEIGYTFEASGNYEGSKSGTITVTAQDAPTTYAVRIAESEHGAVSSSRRSAERGQTVTLTVTPESGYALETLTVTDSRGNALELSDLGGGKYSFKMPGSRVTVTASFLEDNTLLNFFVDVANADYFYESVKWAVKNSITAGVDDTHFDPDGDCTRAQIVTFLWRAAGCPEAESAAHFADVDPDAYYAKAVAWAVENGVTQGTGETTFSPERPCTRAEAVTFLARALNGKAEPSAAFDDVAAEDYFAAAVAWAVENGITEGTGNRRFSPEARCTRAQIVTFLWRAYGK